MRQLVSPGSQLADFSTATVTSVTASASSVELLAANPRRLGGMVANESAGTLYLKLGETASATSYTIKLFTDDVWELPPGYKGPVHAIWSAVLEGEAARITEW